MQTLNVTRYVAKLRNGRVVARIDRDPTGRGSFTLRHENGASGGLHGADVHDILRSAEPYTREFFGYASMRWETAS